MPQVMCSFSIGYHVTDGCAPNAIGIDAATAEDVDFLGEAGGQEVRTWEDRSGVRKAIEVKEREDSPKLAKLFDAIRELYRVCRGEVRIFPLLEQGGRPVPELLDNLRTSLGIPYSVRRVDYEFQRGGNEMLVLTR